MNVVEIFKQEISDVEGIEIVMGRPLRNTDPTGSIGVFPLDWTPDIESMEMLGPRPAEPTLQVYQISIQTFVKNTSQEEGILHHAILSKMVRAMLYRGESLRVRLPQLSESTFGSTERLHQWGVRQQRFITNEIDQSFVFMSAVDTWIKTETL